MEGTFHSRFNILFYASILFTLLETEQNNYGQNK